MNKLWTIQLDYMATGEGRTMIAMICYADNEQDAIKKFAKEHGSYYAIGAEAMEGIVETPLVLQLITKDVLKFAKENEFKASIIITNSLHYNFS